MSCACHGQKPLLLWSTIIVYYADSIIIKQIRRRRDIAITWNLSVWSHRFDGLNDLYASRAIPGNTAMLIILGCSICLQFLINQLKGSHCQILFGQQQNKTETMGNICLFTGQSSLQYRPYSNFPQIIPYLSIVKFQVFKTKTYLTYI